MRIGLGDDDVAIVLRSNGDMHLFIPKKDPVSPKTLLMATMAIAFDTDSRFLAMLQRRAIKMFGTPKMEKGKCLKTKKSLKK